MREVPDEGNGVLTGRFSEELGDVFLKLVEKILIEFGEVQGLGFSEEVKRDMGQSLEIRFLKNWPR